MTARFTCAVPLLAALGLIAAPLPAAAPVPKAPPPKLTVAYVYGDDEKTADAFKRLLEGDGCAVQVLPLRAVAEADFASYALVVVGSDTEGDGWDLPVLAAVDRSKRPVLALGEGGYTFLGRSQAGLGIGHPNGWHGEGMGVVPVAPAKSPCGPRPG